MTPLLDISGYADYMCAKNLLVAHAKTYHIYNNGYRPSQRDSIGVVLSVTWFEPDSKVHSEAVNNLINFEVLILTVCIFLLIQICYSFIFYYSGVFMLILYFPKLEMFREL